MTVAITLDLKRETVVTEVKVERILKTTTERSDDDDEERRR